MKNPNQDKVCMGKERKPITANTFLSGLGFLNKSRDKNPVRVNSVAMKNVTQNTGV